MSMDITSAVAMYACAVSGLASHTQRWYAYKLRYFAEWCEQHHYRLEDLSPTVVSYYLSYLRYDYTQERRLADSAIHSYMQVVGAFLNWCSRKDGLNAEKSVSCIELPKVERHPTEGFTDEEVGRLFGACDSEASTALIVRDRAILSVLLDTGFKASEIFYDPARPSQQHTGLLLEHVCLSEDSPSVKIVGKDNEWREIALGATSRRYLCQYITRYRGHRSSPYVFLNRIGEALTVRGCQQVLSRLGKRAGVENCCPNRFRHTR